jgi:predicted transcriptional regulator
MMSTLSLRLPESLHQKVKELAERDATSINQFIATAVAEKTAALLTVEYLADRAARGDRTAVNRILRRVPARAPLPGDELPDVGPNKRLQPTKARRASQPKRKRSPRLRG